MSAKHTDVQGLPTAWRVEAKAQHLKSIETTEEPRFWHAARCQQLYDCASSLESALRQSGEAVAVEGCGACGDGCASRADGCRLAAESPPATSGQSGEAVAKGKIKSSLPGDGYGPLPDGAVAWLDMGKGEAELVFHKRDMSNRTKRRHVMALFDGLAPGYHPLYLAPPATSGLVVTEAMVEQGLQAARDASDARLPRYSVVRAILDAALATLAAGGGK